jgi:hypothetical protein
MPRYLLPSHARSTTRVFGGLLLAALVGVAGLRGEESKPVLFDTGFEDASLGQIEVLGENTFRLHVAGQSDERGHNRQANWYSFRMEHVAGRDLTLTLTDFIGEYDDKPGAVAMGPNLRPVFSEDGEHWQAFADMAWDQDKKEATLTFRPKGDTVWIAHQTPYPHSRVLRLLEEIERSPNARVEVIGRTVLGRDLHLVTVTNFARPDETKKTVWLIARQHAWETGTSFAMEGALHFITSDDPRARALRDKTVFKFTPMMDPDGCATGKVRFNAHGFDLNRNWERVNLRDKEWLRKTPEIWYVKKAILADHARHPIDLLVNLHNNENNEYMETMIENGPQLALIQRFFSQLAAGSTFDPSRATATVSIPRRVATNVLWTEDRVPVTLVEQRIAPVKKLGRRPTAEDRIDFGRDLIAIMGEAVQ